MDKIEKMQELVKEFEKASDGTQNGIAAMFGATEESSNAFNEMWDYARENGFVNPFTKTITDRPVIKIYANYGVLPHEKETVYTYSSKQSEICEELYIEIPEGFKVYEQVDGAGTILSADEGYDYTVDELLKNVGGSPAFAYVGKDGGYRTFKCRILEEV